MSSLEERTALRPLLESFLRVEAGATSVGRLCPRCGSTTHGQPRARRGDGTALHVSLGYAAGLGLVAWSSAGAVGIDVEVDGAPVDGVGDRLTWTRHEALAKASGLGLDAVELPDLPTINLLLPAGYVGTAAGVDVSWRWAGPAAPAGRATS